VQRLLGNMADGPLRPLTLKFSGVPANVVSQAMESPDGRWVAFLGITGEQRDIWVAPANGGIASNITNNPAEDTEPVWSPDGSQLAFASERDGGIHVWLQPMRDGQPIGIPVRLTAGVPEEQVPAWSPDGQQVALVTATPNGGREAAVVPSVGRGVPTVVTSGAEAWRVKWMRGGLLLVSGWEGAGKGLSLRAVDPTRKTTVDSFPAIALGTDMISAGFDITRDGKYLALVRGRGDGRIGVLEAKSGKF